MPKESGMGMQAFFAQRDRKPKPSPKQGQAPRTVRTSIRLTREDADLLEILRMHLRHHRGRSLTYSDVVGMALRCLAEREPIPKLLSPTQT